MIQGTRFRKREETTIGVYFSAFRETRSKRSLIKIPPSFCISYVSPEAASAENVRCCRGAFFFKSVVRANSIGSCGRVCASFCVASCQSCAVIVVVVTLALLDL